jgi:hypothetical protein
MPGNRVGQSEPIISEQVISNVSHLWVDCRRFVNCAGDRTQDGKYFPALVYSVDLETDFVLVSDVPVHTEET